MSAEPEGASLVEETPEGPRLVPLAEAAVLVGRGAGADLRILDASLSTRHCRVEPAGDGWKIVDLESRNGTFVNDVLVKQRLLQDGDRIRLGRVQLRFHSGPASQDLLAEVGRMVSRLHRRLGKDGLRAAAERFREAAARRGVRGLLAHADEISAAQQLQSVAQAMLEESRPAAIFERIVDALIDFTGAERGFCIVGGPAAVGQGLGDGERRVVAARNLDREEVTDALAKVSRTIEGLARAGGDPVIVTDATVDERFSGTESVADMRLRSVLAVPLAGKTGAAGIIYLDNRFERGVFQERQLPTIRAFADQASIALRNAGLHEENARRLAELAAAKSEVEELNRILAERMARTSAELQEVKDHVLRERAEAPLKYSYGRIVGASRGIRELFHLLDKVTDSDVPVLIQGESGTGKELVARAIHFNGPRKERPFVSENCAAIPETLLESELFGYARGAFTGATADKKGLFEAANGGTLLLDEIGDMPLEMQKKLLRVLQEGELRPVGGKRTVRVDVRILAASNQDLRGLCAAGRFREDLYYRLAVITVDIPPLRERREDIPLLVQHFIDRIAEESGQPPKVVSEDALRALSAYAWPGNVRELRNEVLRASALSDRVIVPLILSEAVRGRGEELPVVADLGRKTLKDMVREVTEDLERRVIRAALDRARGRKTQAARLLGVSRPTLDAKIEAYSIPVHRP